MKKLTAVLCLFALLFLLVGCAGANALQQLDAAEDRVEAKLDAAEDRLEDSLRKSVSPAPVQTQPTSVESRPMLTEAEARDIALEYLGLTADQVTRLWVEFEIDDGVPQFDVSFYQGDWEYEFEIHAENGQILSYDKDHKYD